MTTRLDDIQEALDRLRSAAARLDHTASFMEVCGTHTMSAFRCGLHSLMPDNARLLSGPGCPVCVTAQGDIDLFVDLAMRAIEGESITICTYGDMLRVPGTRGNLEQARSRGADVRVVYSAMDAIRLARQDPTRQVVFTGVGFETTAPATAAAVVAAQQQGLGNFTVLVSHKLIMPAMRALLDGQAIRLDGFLCPGHVSVIIGFEAFAEIVRDYRLPCVVAGFEPLQIAAALARLVEQVAAGEAKLENMYPQAVTPEGNIIAQKLLGQVFEPADMAWRGLTRIPKSGLALRDDFRQFDAMARFGLVAEDVPEPAGCLCGQVITAQATPLDCKLFGTVCTPIHPVGPCMVSSEGTCQAYFKYHRHGDQESPERPAATTPV